MGVVYLAAFHILLLSVLNCKMGDQDVEKLELRNRTVNEVFEPVDTLELRNRTVNEIFSPVADLGQDAKNETEKKDAGDSKPEENKKNDDDGVQHDTLELRGRTVNEIFSPVSELGQDNPDEPSPKKQKFDTL